jgi:hypothetical protein
VSLRFNALEKLFIFAVRVCLPVMFASLTSSMFLVIGTFTAY